MGRKLHYRPGSYYVTDDRTGFPQRAERTRMQWNRLRVDESVWEPRQPQDLVRGVKDDQTVPNARPLAPATFVGPIYGQLAQAGAPGDDYVVLDSTANMQIGDYVGVMMNDGVVFDTGIIGFGTGDTVFLATELLLNAASGNAFVDYRISYPFLSYGLLCENGQFLVQENGGHILLEI